jgi:hypothetical protein
VQWSRRSFVADFERHALYASIAAIRKLDRFDQGQKMPAPGVDSKVSRASLLAVVLVCCAHAAATPPTSAPSFMCVTARTVTANARSLRDAGHLRAALPEIERADKLCRGRETWSGRRDLYEALGREQSLAALATELADDAEALATVRAALDRARAAQHGSGVVDALVIAARAQTDPVRAKAIFEHAIDEAERTTSTKGERVSIANNPGAIGMMHKDWLSLGEGLMLDTRGTPFSALDLNLKWVDVNGVWAWVARGLADQGEELWNLRDVRRVLEPRTIALEDAIPGFLVWTEGDTLHLYDVDKGVERSRPMGGDLDGPIVIAPDRASLWWSTGTRLHALDPKTDVETTYAEPGVPSLTTFSVGADGWVALAWDGLVVVKHGSQEVFRASASASLLKLDAPDRVAWYQAPSFVVVDLKPKAKPTKIPTSLASSLPQFACGVPNRIESLGATSLLVSHEDGDIGCIVSYSFGRKGMSATAGPMRTPGDDYAAVQEMEAVCTTAHVDCRCKDLACEGSYQTSAGTVMVTADGRAIRVDDKGKAVVELASFSANHVLATPEGPYVVDFGKSVRVWDAGDGRLVWSSEGREFCRFGVRLYPIELCE